MDPRDKAEILAAVADVGTTVAGVSGVVTDLVSRVSRLEKAVGSLPPPPDGPEVVAVTMPPILTRLPKVEKSDETQDDRLGRLEQGQEELRKHIKAQSAQQGVDPDAKTLGERANAYVHSSRLLPDVVRIVLLVVGIIAASKGVTVQQIPAPVVAPAPALPVAPPSQ